MYFFFVIAKTSTYTRLNHIIDFVFYNEKWKLRFTHLSFVVYLFKLFAVILFIYFLMISITNKSSIPNMHWGLALIYQHIIELCLRKFDVITWNIYISLWKQVVYIRHTTDVVSTYRYFMRRPPQESTTSRLINTRLNFKLDMIGFYDEEVHFCVTQRYRDRWFVW